MLSVSSVLSCSRTKWKDLAVAQVLPAALALSKSPLLQGSALEALQAFFSALPSCEPAGVSSDSLLASLLKAGQAKVPPPSGPCTHV